MVAVRVRGEATMTDTRKAAARGPTQTKAARLRAMLAEPEGASLARIMAETGWQAHTVRAALSGLRKAGTSLARERVDEVTVYRIVVGGAAARTVAPDATHTPGADA
jgi:hypothetical protein